MTNKYVIGGYGIPTSQVEYIGQSASITCYSSTKPVWTKDDNKLRRGIKVTDKSIVISSVKWDDMGIYTCEGTTRGGILFEADSELFVAGKSCVKPW